MDRPILVSPGPVDVPGDASSSIAQLHHRSLEFEIIVEESAGMVREALGTSHPVHFIAASGTGAMEAAVANATAPGARLLVVSCGKFGDRWAEIAAAYDCDVSTMRLSEGSSVDVEAVVDRVRSERPRYLALTHVESSTGLLFPLRELARLLGEDRPVVIVDAVSSFIAEEMPMDEWGIDVVVGASQKALAAPAGVSFVAMGARARAGASRRGLYYFDLERYGSGAGKSATPFTPAVQTMQIAHRTLSEMRRLGFDAVRSRHERSSRAFLSACGALGLASFPDSPSSAVQALRLPGGISSETILGSLARRGFIAAGGQGKLRGSIIRTGFLGLHGASTLIRLVGALGESLRAAGIEADLPGAEKRMREYDEAEPLFRPLR